MPPPAAVFLDLGNVVVRWHPDRLCANLAALAGTTPDRVARLLAAAPEDPAYVEGRIDTAAFRTALGAALGVRFEPAAFAAAWTAVFERDPAMEALVAELAPRVPTFALSNTNALHYEWLRANVPALRAFRAIVASHEVGRQKPDPRIYAHARAVAGCDAAACLFVDDLPVNVAGARAAGWQAIPFTGAADLRRTLAAAGLPLAPTAGAP
jgi:putative hydrolase of the HAD superfamily